MQHPQRQKTGGGADKEARAPDRSDSCKRSDDPRTPEKARGRRGPGGDWVAFTESRSQAVSRPPFHHKMCSTDSIVHIQFVRVLWGGGGRGVRRFED